MNVGTIIEFIESMVKSTTISNSGDGAYGSGMAGTPFDPLGFIKKPQVILRIISLLFAVIVLGSIICEDLYKQGTCPLNEDATACSFGLTLSTIALLACIAFLIIDARFDSFSNVKTRKRAVVVDLAFSGFWAALWFLGFCYMANEWRKTSDDLENRAEAGNVRLALIFSFLSILSWAMICLLNFLRYRQGVSTIFSSSYDEHEPNFEYEGIHANNAHSDDYPNQNSNYSNINNNNYNNGGYQQSNY